MSADPAITALAQETFRRRVDLAPAPTLVLGLGFARAAGIPPFSELARAAVPATIPETERVSEFRGWLERGAPVDRAIIAAQITGTIPVPQFAQELALLARDGFFGTIVTRSFDALPERALEMTGLFDEEGYRIVDCVDEEWDGNTAGLVVIKAYREWIDRTPPTQPALDGMVIVVGAGESDTALVNALAYEGGPLWWVDRHPPPPPDRDAYQRARDLRLVVGAAGEPDRFFGELSLLLQQIPSVNVAKMPRKAVDESRALVKNRSSSLAPGRDRRSVVAARGGIGGVSPDDEAPEEFERRLLRTRTQRCRDAIRRLRRRGGGMSIDEGVDRQLEYQLQLLDRLEIQLRTLEPTKQAMLVLLSAIRDASVQSGDAATTEYLDGLIARIDDEYRRPDPNQDIVGATLGAVAILAERVGVSPALVKQLSAYAPNTKRGAL